ncbi:MAG: Mpo1-like protein [Polyangia bacterium]
MALLSERSWNDWITEYAKSHHHPVNRVCHTIGIPMIALAVLLFAAAAIEHALWIPAAVLFVVGWLFQFVGHAFERKPPEFFKDWRFLFVGLRWWAAKLRGKV